MRLALLALAASAAVGCGSTAAPEPRAAGATEAAARPAAAQRTCERGATQALGSPRRSWAAVVRDRAVAFRTPGGRRLASFGRRNVNGVPTVLGVLARRVDARCRAAWYRVLLPVRPNGVSGWVRADALALAPVTTRLLVDLSDRRVTLFDRGRPVRSVPAAIGSPATPTPTGRFYVNQRLVPEDPAGPFGPGAIGISAFSEVLTGWAQGGPIAIHGTNRPDLVGRAVSNGCVRVRNDELRRLFDRVLAGTPVVVRA